MIYKISFCVFVIFIVFFIFSEINVKAQNAIVGVSPGRHVYDNVLRGGYSERNFLVSSSTEEDIFVSAEFLGPYTSWFNYSENISGVNSLNPWNLLVSVEPPFDTPNGNYTTILRIQSSSLGGENEEGHATGTVVPVLDVVLVVEVTDIEIIECSASSFRILSAEKGDDLVFSVDVENFGNIKLRPRISVDVWDKEQITIVESFEHTGEQILPTRKNEVEFNYPTDEFEEDQYWADMSVVECFASDTLTFDVFEPGALKANGLLRKIVAPATIEVDETTALFAIFENTGEKEVEAQFRGQITLGEKIVQVIEGDTIDVPVNEIANFTFFFTPQIEGRYAISGRVYYDQKITAENNALLIVLPKKSSIKSYLLASLYFIIIIIVAILFLKIRKERRRYMGKI